MKKCQENGWVLEHLNSEQELSIWIEKYVAKISPFEYEWNISVIIQLLENQIWQKLNTQLQKRSYGQKRLD